MGKLKLERNGLIEIQRNKLRNSFIVDVSKINKNQKQKMTHIVKIYQKS